MNNQNDNFTNNSVDTGGHPTTTSNEEMSYEFTQPQNDENQGDYHGVTNQGDTISYLDYNRNTNQEGITSNQMATNQEQHVPRIRRVSKMLNGYDYLLPPSLMPNNMTSTSANSVVYPISKQISY